MRKILFVLALFFVIPFTVFAKAPDRAGETDAGFGVAARYAKDGDWHDTVYLSGSVTRGITPWLAVGVSGGWTDSGLDVNPGNGAGKFRGTRLAATPVFGDVILRTPAGDWPVIPYADLGLGMMISHTHGDGVLNNNNLESHSNDGFAMKFGGGVDWFVTDNWIYNVEIAYVLTSADVEFKNRGTQAVVDTADLDFWYIGGALKYRFS